MALAKKCDVCGKFYDHYEAINDYDGAFRNYNTLTVYRKTKYEKSTTTKYNFDLCPECMKAFEEWINNRKEDKDE